MSQPREVPSRSGPGRACPGAPTAGLFAGRQSDLATALYHGAEVSTMTFPIKPPFPIPGGDDSIEIEIEVEDDGEIDIDD